MVTRMYCTGWDILRFEGCRPLTCCTRHSDGIGETQEDRAKRHIHGHTPCNSYARAPCCPGIGGQGEGRRSGTRVIGRLGRRCIPSNRFA